MDVFQSISVAPISLIHSSLPFWQHRVDIQSAERTQVHVSGITAPANSEYSSEAKNLNDNEDNDEV